MIRNIVFDYGGVLIDWNPRYLFDSHFSNPERYEFFLREVCNGAWNSEMDLGKPFDVGVAERCALFPEFEEEIKMYRDRWIVMIGGQLPGAEELVLRLKENGYHVWGLTNWCCETFNQVRDIYPVFKLMEGMVVSGEEGILKPDPAMYRKMMDRYGLTAGESVFIDDKAENVCGAEDVGMKGIHYENLSQLKQELRKLNVNI